MLLNSFSITSFIYWREVSVQKTERGINIQVTTICYSLQDRDICYRNAMEFQMERQDEFLHSKTEMLYMKLVYLQRVFPQMYQYFKGAY